MSPERVERKLAAILAADVSGYSRLMGADEEGTLSLLKTHRRELVDLKIAEHRGRVVKTTGDGLLVEFPSVVDAVRCAIDVQREMAERNTNTPKQACIEFRVGINLGDIIIDDDDIHGDGVNIAARLEGIAEPGGICISESAYQQVRDKLDVHFQDRGEQRLKNIARTVRAYHWRPAGGGAPAARGPRSRRLRIGALAVVVLSVVAAAGWWILAPSRESAPAALTQPRDTRPLAPARLAVAVLPFANLGGDPAREYFNDGLTEELIGALGRFTALSVLSRNAVMPFKGKPVSIVEAANTLGVRYLVEGTVRQADAHVRVSVQLSDAADGRLLWSEQFDAEMRDVIGLQERIARRVAGVLAVRLTRAEEQRTAKIPTDNLEAYDLVLRGRAQLSLLTRRGNVEARRLFQRAMTLDDRYADARLGLAISLFYAIEQGWVADPEDALNKAEAATRESIRLDDRSSRGYAFLARLLVVREQFDQAKEAGQRSIELNPSDADGYWNLGTVLLWSSEIAKAIEALEAAASYDPLIDQNGFARSLAYYLADRPQDAITYVERKVGRQGRNAFTYVVLSMAYADLGKPDEAAELVGLARRRNPGIDPEQFGTLLRDPKLRAKVRAGLQKAGWF